MQQKTEETIMQPHIKERKKGYYVLENGQSKTRKQGKGVGVEGGGVVTVKDGVIHY